MVEDRYRILGGGSPLAAPGWSIERVLGPSTLFGANGMRVGPDGLVYVAQAFGSQISALDPETGAAQVVSPIGGEILAPDDLAFDSHGTLYTTEVFSARVSARSHDGSVRVIAADLPVANGITIHHDRIFVDEFRVGGRVLEVFADGRAPRVIAEDLALPNALALGPDDYLYFPLVLAGEIWRVPVEGGAPERVIGGLAQPTAVKFDPSGRLTTVQAGSGDVTRIDVAARTACLLATLPIGIDNLAFAPDGRLFVSHFTDGSVAEITSRGGVRPLVPPGLVGPCGLAFAPDGTLAIADGMSLTLRTLEGRTAIPAMLLTHGFPGYIRGVAAGPDGSFYFTNSAGGVALYSPGDEAKYLATDLDLAMGIAIDGDGAAIVCEAGTGNLLKVDRYGTTKLASGLAGPSGIAVGADGSYYVSEAAGGRVTRIRGTSAETLIDGLLEPHGVAVSGDDLFVLDRAGKALWRLSLGARALAALATELPVGSAPAITPKTLPGIPGVMPGPLEPFADIAIFSNTEIFIAGDADGSVLSLRRKR